MNHCSLEKYRLHTSYFIYFAFTFHFQNKVYDEIYCVLGDSDQPITIEDTTKLVYLEQVLKETLRLYPIVPLFTRELEDDVKISEYDRFSILSL